MLLKYAAKFATSIVSLYYTSVYMSVAQSTHV